VIKIRRKILKLQFLRREKYIAALICFILLYENTIHWVNYNEHTFIGTQNTIDWVNYNEYTFIGTQSWRVSLPAS
jgi:hypothetical protein